MQFLRCLASLVVCTSLLFSTVEANSRQRNPLNYLSVLEHPRIHTPSQRVHAFSSFDLSFDLHGNTQSIKLTLEPNHDIIHENAHIEYVDQHGNVRQVEKIQREDHKVFQGKSWVLGSDGWYHPTGWARIVIRRDGAQPLFEGVFSIFGDPHHVQMRSNYMQTKHIYDPEIQEDEDEYMTVFRDSDISQHSQTEVKRELDLTCQADNLEFNTNPNHPLFRPVVKRTDGVWGTMSFTSLLGKRQNSIDGNSTGGNSGGVNLKASIGNTAGCPSTRKVALVGVATDCTYTGAFNSTDSVRQNVITQINSASDLYQTTFNITIGLANLTVSDAECPSTASASVPWNIGCNGNTTITDRLNLFSGWRGQRADNNAYWSLFSTCNTDAEVGLAWLGQLCISGASSQTDTTGATQSVTGANVVVRTSTEWQVFAHETGHTFGAVHDCTSQTCSDGVTVNAQQCCPLSQSTCDANGQYIMNPSSTPGVNTFSPCTLGNICSALGRNSVKSDCLSDNKGVVTISGSQCGNGIVEAGEDCDCGGTQGCGTDNCCNPTTCKFSTGAVCDPSNEGCCTSSCQFSVAGTVCRASTGICDPQEVCSGNNATCPSDTTAPDGTACGNGTNLACASGQCTSRNSQCMTLMASYTQDNDTYACNSQGCSVSCASPEFGPNVCYSMQQNFLDGTPCNGGGKCNNGVCQGSTVGGEVKSWIDDNKTLVIALASAIGALVILAILGCIWRACTRPKKVPKQRRPPNVNYGWDGPMPPPMQQRGGWGDSTLPGQWHPPPPPPHTYGGYGGGRSIRYA